uniref:diguanylate cyclase n=1 Tax=Magnetococcus massalia (strain MO-1) TaxID=451514 RepID=A0A1S7LL16_MAGMO|nr:putative diguanylate cyclase [Candidatus Magnetococcus massalia]
MNVTQYRGEKFDDLHLFMGVGYESVSYALEDCMIRILEHNEILIDPDHPNDSLYVVLDGKLRVHLGKLHHEPFLELEEGSCVGELSIIDSAPASAYVVCEGGARVLVVDEDKVWSLIYSSHGVACNLLTILSKRMRHNNRVIIEGHDRQRTLENYAKVDPLTGIHNRRALDEALSRQLRRVAHSKNPLCLIMLDVDHFKNYNDTYGHQGGDVALVALAQNIAGHLRPGDIAARYGGEEFTVVLPDTRLEMAFKIAERLRKAVEAMDITDGTNTKLARVNISLGVAQTSTTITAVEPLIAAADAALYRAKNNGRNRVEVHTEEKAS